MSSMSPSSSPSPSNDLLPSQEATLLFREGPKLPAPYQTDIVLSRFGSLHDKRSICHMDLELTCWENPPGERGYTEEQEVIEIGVVVTDAATGAEQRRISSFVRPTIHPILSPFCTNLTGITQADVDGAVPLPEALRRLMRELPEPKDFVFASFGRDPEWVAGELERKTGNSDLLFDPRYVNVSLLNKLHTGGKSGGMAKALESHGLPLEEPHHRALPDAVGVMRLYRSMNLSPTDALVAKSTTYNERIELLKKNRVQQLRRHVKINEQQAVELLKAVRWDVAAARKVAGIFGRHR